MKEGSPLTFLGGWAIETTRNSPWVAREAVIRGRTPEGNLRPDLWHGGLLTL
jgi:hypothetical protein